MAQQRDTVFGRGRSGGNPLVSMTTGGAGAAMFRRTAADATPARENVTAAIMGDPKPGRFNFKALWSPQPKDNRP